MAQAISLLALVLTPHTIHHGFNKIIVFLTLMFFPYTFLIGGYCVTIHNEAHRSNLQEKHCEILNSEPIVKHTMS